MVKEIYTLVLSLFIALLFPVNVSSNFCAGGFGLLTGVRLPPTQKQKIAL